MSELTNIIQNIGMHDCSSNTYTISTTEAQLIRDEIKNACIDTLYEVDSPNEDTDAFLERLVDKLESLK